MFRYETHLHTALVSACSKFQPQEIVEKYVRLGYTGLFVTDHFMRGNSSVPHSLPWREQVRRFMQGYLAVKEAAEGKLSVFFGFEISDEGTDFLVYGLGEEWLSRHPEIMTLRVNEFCALMRAEGGTIVQAHPYREAGYIDHICLYPRAVDGLEAVNTCNGTPLSNGLTAGLAEAYGLKQSAGSDIHGKELKRLAGMEFESKLTSVEDFCERFKRGEGRIFTVEEGEI